MKPVLREDEDDGQVSTWSIVEGVTESRTKAWIDGCGSAGEPRQALSVRKAKDVEKTLVGDSSGRVVGERLVK